MINRKSSHKAKTSALCNSKPVLDTDPVPKHRPRDTREREGMRAAKKSREAARKARRTQVSGPARPDMEKWKGRPQISPKTSRRIAAVLGQNDAQLPGRRRVCQPMITRKRVRQRLLPGRL